MFLSCQQIPSRWPRASGHVPVCGLECAEGKHAEIGVLLEDQAYSR